MALTEEETATIELVGSTLRTEGRDAAYGRLREITAGLTDPQRGREKAHVSYLLELNALAEELGSIEQSNLLWERVLAIRVKLLPSDDPDLIATKQSLALTRYGLGDLEGTRELEEEVLAAQERILTHDHPLLIDAKRDLASTLYELGDLAGTRELEEEVLTARERTLPGDHSDLLEAKQDLAATLYELDDLLAAHELFEEVFVARTRTLPPDDPDLANAKQNLAATRMDLGNREGARELFEEVLATRLRLLGADHQETLTAKQNLAAARAGLGDLQGARELFEEVLSAQSRFLSPDDAELLATKQNLAAVRRETGDIVGAHEIEEELLQSRSVFMSEEDPDLLWAKENLAVTRAELGDLLGARQLQEQVLMACSQRLPFDHPRILDAKHNLATTLSELGDFVEARQLGEEVLKIRSYTLPADHPLLLAAQHSLAVTRTGLGDLAGARELVWSLLAGVRVRSAALRFEAARLAREGVCDELKRIFGVIYLGSVADPEHLLEPELFVTLESLRIASVVGAEVADVLARRPELDELASVAREKRALLSALSSAAPEEDGELEEWRRSVIGLADERDQIERVLGEKLLEAGASVDELDVATVAGSLKQDAAVASFLRYPKWFDDGLETDDTSVDSLLAFVVRPDSSVRRVELGGAEELETLVRDWRGALGRPLEARGGGRWEAPESPVDLAAIGERLRQRILDPVLATAGDARTLHLVLDDFLYLVPIDALPLGEGLVGEHFEVRSHVTLLELLRERKGNSAAGLLVAGGVDYEVEIGEDELVRLHVATPPVDGGTRAGGASGGFRPLPQTRGEVAAVAALFAAAFDEEPIVLLGAGATKAALLSAAPQARFLHLATHGWFASEACKSQLDSLSEGRPRETSQRAEETLVGFAPETLCGLALAGANRGKDAFGRVPGILTAEELTAFDLRSCELAVLSACETNVGIRRAGQGIQSLQTALHAAGARTAITSLWKVDDAATRRLFEIFYTKLWQEGLGKADALWQAKMALRAEGHPLRDWAGWVLSGEVE